MEERSETAEQTSQRYRSALDVRMPRHTAIGLAGIAVASLLPGAACSTHENLNGLMIPTNEERVLIEIHTERSRFFLSRYLSSSMKQYYDVNDEAYDENTLEDARKVSSKENFIPISTPLLGQYEGLPALKTDDFFHKGTRHAYAFAATMDVPHGGFIPPELLQYMTEEKLGSSGIYYSVNEENLSPFAKEIYNIPDNAKWKKEIVYDEFSQPRPVETAGWQNSDGTLSAVVASSRDVKLYVIDYKSIN